MANHYQRLLHSFLEPNPYPPNQTSYEHTYPDSSAASSEPFHWMAHHQTIPLEQFPVAQGPLVHEGFVPHQHTRQVYHEYPDLNYPMPPSQSSVPEAISSLHPNIDIDQRVQQGPHDSESDSR